VYVLCAFVYVGVRVHVFVVFVPICGCLLARFVSLVRSVVRSAGTLLCWIPVDRTDIYGWTNSGLPKAVFFLKRERERER
jgi:hypothetical protein